MNPDVYIVNILDTFFDNELLKKLKQVLSSEEKEVLSSFKFSIDKNRYLLTHSFKRLLLKIVYQIEQPNFILNEYGKPYISGNPIFFNISHSDQYICLAFYNKEIGIDLEKMNIMNKNEIESILTFFSKYERILLYYSGDYNSDFYKLWVLNEAYIKFLGMGFSKSIDSFSILFKEENIRLFHQDLNYEEKKCQFFEITEIEDCRCFLCTEEKVNPNVFYIDHNYFNNIIT